MMKKMIPVLIAGLFSAGVFAQAVTTKPGQAMGPTTSTEASKGGPSKSTGTEAKPNYGKASAPAVVTKPGGAMGPTDTTAASKGGGSTSGAMKSSSKDATSGNPGSAVTIQPGGAMGSAGTGTTSAGPKK